MFSSQWFANPSSTYEIDNSCIFNDDDTATLSRTPSEGGNRKTWTISLWAKFAIDASSGSALFGSGANSTEDAFAYIQTGGALDWIIRDSSTLRGRIITNRLFRDPSAWYHFVFRVDTTDATAGDRMRLYVNGVEETSFATDTQPAEDTESTINKVSTAQYIGLSRTDGGSNLWNGNLAEIHLIDGTALTSSSFGETNDEGVWVPKAYSGSYGTNGIHLKFQDSSALGDDTSGNGNDYTANNLAAADQRTDTPTNNQVTFNYLNNQQSGGTLTEGNTVYSGPGTRTMVSLTANLPPTGKWAVAFSVNDVSTGNGWNFGITKSNNSNFGDAAGSNEDVGASDGINMNPSGSEAFLYDYINSSSIDPSQAITTSDEFWLAVDMATGKCFLGIYDASATAMVWIAADSGVDGNPATGANPSVTISDMIGSTDYTFAAGAKAPVLTLIRSADLDGTIPTGYTYFENVSDFPAPTLKDPSTNFQAVLFTGTGSSRSVTNDGNSDMQPDIIWIGGISDAYNKGVFDAARGVQKELQSTTNAAETTLTAGISSFDSDGFSFNGTNYNTNTYTFVAWQWSAGNSGASNENGTINTTTTYSDSTAGVSVSTYTGTGSAATIGHGLGVAPKLIMVKNRSATDAWKVYHSGVASDPQTDYLVLNTNAASVDDSTVWNDTAPTSTVFSIGTHTDVNTDDETYVAYAFAEVSGFSKFGTYTGNGNGDAPVAICGFKPAFAIIKRVDSTGDWPMKDTARSPDNEAHETLYANTTAANFGMGFDILSNGFKPKTTDATINASGGTYIFLAFAESPFGGDDVAPATAR
jgi:hypothetical protein